MTESVERPLAPLAATGRAAEKPAKTQRSLIQRINWINTLVISIPTICAIYGLFTTAWCRPTLVFMLFYYYLTGIGITAGYHRLWAHRAYTAHPILEWFLAFMGAAAYEGSAKWWCRNHRIHHRYIDTEQDPYNATRGFVYTHWGWMVLKQDYRKLGRTDISDLKQRSVLELQHTYYLPIAFTFGILLPCLVAGLGWGDWRGGFFFAAMLRIVLVHNSTFFVNSLAHSSLFGAKQLFSDQNTSHDSVITALLTLGEGYHNFHHEFPNDYRNGIRAFDYDPTKWTIRVCAMLGLATSLSRVPKNEIDRERVEMSMKHLRRRMTNIDVGPEPATLPAWCWAAIGERVKKGEKLIVVDGYVVDVKKELPIGSGLTHQDSNIQWYEFHPGGKQMLDVFVGKDASTAFHGEVYKHSQAAKNIIQRLRVARVDGWKEE